MRSSVAKLHDHLRGRAQVEGALHLTLDARVAVRRVFAGGRQHELLRAHDRVRALARLRAAD